MMTKEEASDMLELVEAIQVCSVAAHIAKENLARAVAKLNDFARGQQEAQRQASVTR